MPLRTQLFPKVRAFYLISKPDGDRRGTKDSIEGSKECSGLGSLARAPNVMCEKGCTVAGGLGGHNSTAYRIMPSPLIQGTQMGYSCHFHPQMCMRSQIRSCRQLYNRSEIDNLQYSRSLYLRTLAQAVPSITLLPSSSLLTLILSNGSRSPKQVKSSTL